MQRLDGRGVGHVAGDGVDLRQAPAGLGQPLRIAAGDDHRVAALEKQPGQLEADAVGAAGDEDGALSQLHGISAFVA